MRTSKDALRTGGRWRGLHRTALAAAVVALVAGWFPASPALGAPVSEIVTRWAAGTPDSSTPGQVVVAEVRVNVNDDNAAPSNEPVPDFTATFTTSNGKFTELPSNCLVDGVTTASSISADGTSMVCNFGTQVEGTAIALQVPIQVDGAGGERLTFDGAVGDVAAPQLQHDIIAPFMMDLDVSMPSGIVRSDSATRHVQFEWTLYLSGGSEPGPADVTFRVRTAVSAGTVQALTLCEPFTDQTPSGHPNSGAGSPAERTAPFAACQITAVSPGVYDVTLSDIDYSLTQVPTHDSGGSLLPADRSAVASGKFTVRINSASAGSVTLSVDDLTYTSPSGQTAVDDPSNNTVSKTWANPGSWISSWNRFYTEAGGSPHDDTYRVSPGTVVRSSSYFAEGIKTMGLPDNAQLITCSILDTKYVEYESVSSQQQPGASPVTGATFWWYVGSTQPALDPRSDQYNPNSLSHCGNLSGGQWVTTEPADKSTIQAVRMNMTYGAVKNNISSQMFVEQRIRETTPVGTDVWQFSSRFIGSISGDGWQPININNGVLTPTPGARHAHTNGFRDILRVVGITPAVDKQASSTVARPGVPVTYTLEYSANGGAAAPETVDGYVITDTLPVGLAYATGSASPEPVITTTNGQQVLTWTLDGVRTNTTHTLTYEAELTEDAVPGERLVNMVRSSAQGQTSAESSASVTVSTSGRTIIGKSADQDLIPNVDGDGNGTGSWTVSLRSEDPTTQTFTDVIDILPYNGDGRGTAFSGDYAVTDVIVTGGGTVFYTTADPTTLTDDPADPANGAAGDIAGNTVGWSSTAPADLTAVTAVRVIGDALTPGAVRSFQVVIETDGAEGGDTYVNRAQGRSAHTELVMRTSAPTTMSQHYAFDLKKYVLGADGEWHDAQDANEADWPSFAPTDTAMYKFVVTNTGKGDLADIVVRDPLLDVEWPIESLAAGESVESAEYPFALTGTDTAELRNEACASAPLPADSTQDELADVCDESNLLIGDFTVSKTSDPRSGTMVSAGDTIEYTVEVRHVGAADVTASFTDTLEKVLDDADYNGDLVATAGFAEIVDDELSWSGELVKGDIVTVTYSVTVHLGGDRELTNVVTSPGECVPAPDGNPDCTTHHEGTASLAWEKVNAGDTQERLAGSVWELTPVNADHEVVGASMTIEDCVADAAADCTGADADPEAGMFRVEGLDGDWYRLVETRAPAGYALDDTPRFIQVDGVTAFADPIENRQLPPLWLPLTGGAGTIWWTVAGIVMIALAGATALLRRRGSRVVAAGMPL